MAEPSDDVRLRIGYWFAVHRDQLRTWWAISIIVLDLALISFFVVSFAGYSLTTVKAVQGIRDMATPLVGSELRAMLEPKALEVGQTVAWPAGNGRYDFAVPVNNLNAAWAATEVRYRFLYGSTTTREEHTTLWPQANAFMIQLNAPATVSSTAEQAKIEITSVSWQRPDSLALFNTDVGFPVSQTGLRAVSGLNIGGTATRFSATVKNSSVHGFRTVRFGVILKDGGVIVAAGEALVERFASFTERPIEVTWLRSLPLSAQATVYPIVNLLDSDSYL